MSSINTNAMVRDVLRSEPITHEKPRRRARYAPAGNEPRLLSWLVLTLAIAAAWSFAFVPLRASQDEWWHLKAGKWIVEHGRLPETDIFTYAGEGLRWYNHEWLAQMLFYAIYHAGEKWLWGGLRTLITFKSLIVVATFALVAWTAMRRCASRSVASLVALVMADVARRTIYPRPPILSYLLLASFAAVLWQWRARRLRTRWLWALPLVTVLWANLHGMVPLAVAIVGAFAAGEFMDCVGLAWASRGAPERRRSAAHRMIWMQVRRGLLLAGLALVCTVAAMVNPSGAHIFFLGRKFTADPVLQKVIAEMLPTPGLLARVESARGVIWTWNPLYVSFWCSLALFGILLVRRGGRLPTGVDYVLAGLFIYQAVMHVRLLPLYAVTCAPTLAVLLKDELATLRRRFGRLAAYLPALAASVIFSYYVFIVAEPPPQTFFRRNLDLLRGKDREPADYPTPVMQFILRVGFPDRMFSEINYCGYMIWWLSPEHHKLFTDNRFDLFGSRFYLEEATVVHGVERAEARIGRGWQDILDDYGVNFVVISRSAPLNAKLRASGRWAQVYYWIPPDCSPTVGFNVWLRREERFRALHDRAFQIFRQERPTALLPDEFEQWLASNGHKAPTL
ncbi:MAG: hypothetical protein ACP5UB_04415 [Candidatus Sumerlaeaceae bacterium]